jgi:hypothetical protein
MGVRTRGLDIAINAKRQVADAAACAEAKAVIERWNERLSASPDMLWSPTIAVWTGVTRDTRPDSDMRPEKWCSAVVERMSLGGRRAGSHLRVGEGRGHRLGRKMLIKVISYHGRRDHPEG